ncbi:single-stranded DNA-binding protein [Enterococcus cecorum]|uniref:single-stranded DNA-binding protein n=1 Tax=Enterococcus cecorum TaxID=44008 RepID=UPI00148CF0FB|nr:single-stranded DNA-binding protein [Enterococcus cecorum]CAI3255093.1 single-stranded DNA-binding protein [Enterococcus cecorum]CAI3256933.1 single-stranded DNA-binding protein [Enterococcus cecorum]CAI3306724.1 single-stranded DNA-binding protein [Enterococcus cecorum]CAI3310997.1 single-stranded DNA-binding protein [Enterococcus cecorum]CAI3312794.1 single-stranded DNA-binding protein [Enterococcus cecorum]
MISVHAVGRLTKNVELRYGGEQNRAVAVFYLACKRRAKEDKATFIRCVAFDKAAEILSQYTCKGAMLEVTGELIEESYLDQSNISRKYMQVIVDKFEMLESKETMEKRKQANNSKNYDYREANTYEQPPIDGMSEFGYLENR